MAPSLDLHAMGEQIAEDVAHIDAAHHRVLTKLRIFDDGGGWFKQGFRTCAQWLSWRVGWGINAAREHVRVANALGKLPLIDNALARGELSYCKVRAITRVATPENEAVLLEQARLTTGYHLEMICRKYALVRRHEADAKRPSEDQFRRYVTRRQNAEGMSVIEACLHPDEADLLWAAIERVAAERCRAASAPASASASGADSSSSADSDSATTSEKVSAETRAAVTSAGVSAETSAQPSDAHAPVGSHAPRKRPRFDRADALVHIAMEIVRGTRRDRSPTEMLISIPIDTLQDPNTADPMNVGCCANGTVISAAAARRLACDAGIVPFVEDERGNILAVGRKQRTISGSMKRALLRRDVTCRFPGCTSRVFLEGHHIEHWADGGETNLANLLSVCSYHHRFLHEYGFALELQPDGTVIGFDADGLRIPEIPSTANRPADLGWPNIARRNAALDITPNTISTWDGTPVDYVECIDWILRVEDRASVHNEGN